MRARPLALTYVRACGRAWALAGLMLACLMLVACAHAPPPPDNDIRLVPIPRASVVGERFLIQIQIGALGAGEEIALRTPDGALIGTVSPHAIRPGHAAGAYLVPLPPEQAAAAATRGQLPLRLLIERAGMPARPARSNEVVSVRIVRGR